jgi:hypothetical protein
MHIAQNAWRLIASLFGLIRKFPPKGSIRASLAWDFEETVKSAQEQVSGAEDNSPRKRRAGGRSGPRVGQVRAVHQGLAGLGKGAR